MKRRNFIQKTILFCSSLGLNPIYVFPKTSFEVSDFEINWKNYLNDPSDETAMAVYKTIPLYDLYDNKKKAKILEHLEWDFLKLEDHVLSGHKYALDISFKLFSITDGALSEYLYIIIGSFIHVDATYFLESLDKHYHLIEIESVLGNYGPDYVDEYELQNIETQARVDALVGVTTLKRHTLKEECIGHLQKRFIAIQNENTLV